MNFTPETVREALAYHQALLMRRRSRSSLNFEAAHMDMVLYWLGHLAEQGG